MDAATCGTMQQEARSLAGGGQVGEAVATLQRLIDRIETEGLAEGEDLAFQLGLSYGYLGRVFIDAHRPDLALEPSLLAIEILEMKTGEVARTNLSAALGDLANSYRALGRLDEALATAERGLAIDRKVGVDRNVAAALGQCAQILSAQERWVEADARYEEALALARHVEDLDLQATLLQDQGTLFRAREMPERAAELYGLAMTLFRQAGNTGGEMQVCEQFAGVERDRGQLDLAEYWYARAAELARARGDRHHLGINAQNVGILHQLRAGKATDAESRQAWLRRAVASIEESLAIDLERNDQLGAAASYFQLGVLYQLMGDLEAAERNALRSLHIAEALDQPDVYKDYDHLADLAAERGNDTAAAEWAAKRDAKLAELIERRGDGGVGGPKVM